MPPRSAFGGTGSWFGGSGLGSGPITQDVGAGEVEVHFPPPGRFGASRPMRLV